MGDIKVRRRKITEYKQNPENANAGTPRGLAVIEDSLHHRGAGRSLLAAADDVFLAGNHTMEALVNTGITDVIEVETDGHTAVVVKRVDLTSDEDKAKILAYEDNRASEVGLAWDVPRLLEDLKQVEGLTTLWTEDELAALVAKAKTPRDEESVPADDSRLKEARAKWNTEIGQLWRIPSGLGAHYLICGDSTDPETVMALFAALPKPPVLMVTDPPYGVEYDAKWRQEYNATSLGKVENDDRVDWSDAYLLFPGDVAYVWHAGVHAGEVAVSLQVAGFEIRSQIIWVKNTLVMSRGHYHWKHEPCYYAVRKGATGHWQGDRKQATVWEIGNMSNAGGKSTEDEPTGHSTQKPLEAMRRPILNHTVAGEYVYDPFSGAGTTIAAAETVGRFGCGVELNPDYVALTLDRLQKMGLTSELVNPAN